MIENPFCTPRTTLEDSVRIYNFIPFLSTQIGAVAGSLYTFLKTEISLQIINKIHDSPILDYDNELVKAYLRQEIIPDSIAGALIGLILGISYQVYRIVKEK